MELLKRSADQGHIPAMKSLVLIYNNVGAGPFYSPQLSLQYLRGAANRGDQESILVLRRMGL